MKKEVKTLSVALKGANLSNKSVFKTKKTTKSIQFLKFLKEKNIINNFEIEDTNEVAVYTNNSTTGSVVKNIEPMLLNHRPVFTKRQDLITLGLDPYVLYVFSTSYGLMDQRDLQKFNIGGVLLCKISLH